MKVSKLVHGAEKESLISWLPIQLFCHQQTLPVLAPGSYLCVYHIYGHLRLCLQLCYRPSPLILQTLEIPDYSHFCVWERNIRQFNPTHTSYCLFIKNILYSH